ncbi:hypothetical protein AVEN_226941-1 [Araneus ventricosus]|uniref:Uncharacterized protein n=1 Tax=Araneus ventricosus TaxID=182803 RepID=A0A4Y2JJT3_ARAVE|nr:hypothetical protein AVEN_226941-1 [Araneus ventricosus]
MMRPFAASFTKHNENERWGPSRPTTAQSEISPSRCRRTFRNVPSAFEFETRLIKNNPQLSEGRRAPSTGECDLRIPTLHTLHTEEIASWERSEKGTPTSLKPFPDYIIRRDIFETPPADLGRTPRQPGPKHYVVPMANNDTGSKTENCHWGKTVSFFDKSRKLNLRPSLGGQGQRCSLNWNSREDGEIGERSFGEPRLKFS